MPVELQACPFCGSPARLCYIQNCCGGDDDEPERWWYVECSSCGASSDRCIGEPVAVAAWNRRAHQSTPGGERGAG